MPKSTTTIEVTSAITLNIVIEVIVPCSKCWRGVLHPWHDDGTVNLRDAHHWERGGRYAPPNFHEAYQEARK